MVGSAHAHSAPSLPRRSRGRVAGRCCSPSSLSACSLPGSGPDAGDAVDELADGPVAGKLTGVDFVGGAAATKQAAASYAEITGGMDGDAEVSVGRGLRPTVTPPPARSTGRWKVGSKTWTYDTTVRLARGETADGDAWLVRWDPALVEPSLKEGERLVESTVRPERGADPRRRGRAAGHARGRCSASGVDKTGLSTAQARRLGRPGRPARRHRRQGLRQAGRGGRPPRLRAGHRLPQAGRTRPRCSPGSPTSRAAAPSRTSCRWRRPRSSPPPSSARSARPPPSWSRRARAGSRPGDDVGLSGLQKRYDEQLTGTRGATVAAVGEGDERRTLFTADPVAGSSLRTTIDLDDPDRGRAGARRRRSGERAGRDPPLDRRPRGGGQRAGLEGLQHRHLRPLRPGLDVQGGQCAGAAARRAHPAVAGELPADHGRGRQVVQELRRLPVLRPRRDHLRGRAGQLVQHRLHLPARQARTARRWTEAAAALGLGVDHDTGFPTFFGEVGTPGQRDPGGGRR